MMRPVFGGLMTFRRHATRLRGLCVGLASVGMMAHAAGVQAPLLPSNHALIITVSEYQRSPLPGVLTDRKLATELATRFGVPPQNIVQLSEQDVTREGLKQAFAGLSETIMPGDKLYVYFSGHGARYFNKVTGQCTESIVMQDMHVVTNAEFAGMIKPLSAKTDKTVVMLDSCHSGGVANAANARALSSPVAAQRPKFSAEASSPQCALAVNLGSFSANRGMDLNTTDHNLVILAASRNNEVAWDTSKGGALTYNFSQCLGGTAADTDHSGSLSMQELTDRLRAGAVGQNSGGHRASACHPGGKRQVGARVFGFRGRRGVPGAKRSAAGAKHAAAGAKHATTGAKRTGRVHGGCGSRHTASTRADRYARGIERYLQSA